MIWWLDTILRVYRSSMTLYAVLQGAFLLHVSICCSQQDFCVGKNVFQTLIQLKKLKQFC